MASQKSFESAVNSIRTFLSARPPYYNGTYPVSPEQLTLFYGSNGSNANRINLAKATPQELGKLEAACQLATFGVNNENVYDESYRKAGKMDFADFATSFDVEDSDLLNLVDHGLLEGDDEQRAIKLELYKLNVYGKGSFFRAHKDTPRSETMFGSLVIVFPTPHEGGEFILRDKEHEWEVDLAKSISESAQQPCVSYAAFFSDVEHEVRMVTSGYRVTLTYNLYFAPVGIMPCPTVSTLAPYEQTLAEALYEIVTNDAVLPDGGYLGIGLRHMYPVEEGTDVTDFRNYLKGPDAALGRVLSALGLSWNVRVFYRKVDSREYLHSRIVDLSKWGQMCCDVIHAIMRRSGAELVQHVHIYGTRKSFYGCSCLDWSEDSEEIQETKYVQLAEVTDLKDNISQVQLYVMYGNEPTVSYAYVKLCIAVDLPFLGARSINRLQVQ
ncbi:hypothetical protein BKA83DRAFT_689342 [Pisolithus microcarpus]|nr:hypothetical protein BKA83DRAFT_689342 [Pisolithus microcarpus]